MKDIIFIACVSLLIIFGFTGMYLAYKEHTAPVLIIDPDVKINAWKKELAECEHCSKTGDDWEWCPVHDVRGTGYSGIIEDGSGNFAIGTGTGNILTQAKGLERD